MAKKPEEKKPRGKPKGHFKIPITDTLIKQVQAMRGYGLNQVQISNCLGINPDTLTAMIQASAELSSAIKSGKDIAALKVMETAHKMATSGRSAPMTMFWLRTQAGWKDQVDVKVDNRMTVVFETEFKNGSLRQTATELPLDENKIIDDIVDGLLEALDA